MPINSNIALGVKQFELPDPIAAYGRVAAIQQAQQQNALAQMKMDEYQRGLQEQNALRSRVTQPGFDILKPEHQAALMTDAPTLAPAYIEKSLLTRKTAGEIQASDFKLRDDRLKHGLTSLTAADTPEQALQAVNEGVQRGYFDQTTADAETKKINDAATAGKYSQYRKEKVLSLLDAKDQLAATSPKPKELRVGDKVLLVDENPNSSTFAQTLSSNAINLSEHERRQLEIELQKLAVSKDQLAVSQGQLKVAQGQLFNAQQRLKFEQDNPGIEVKEQADGSLVGINKRTGAAKPITMDATGQPVMGQSKLTEGQAGATNFGIRMSEADKILSSLEGKGVKDTGLIRTGVSGIAGTVPLIGESLGKGVDNVFNVLPSIMGGLSREQQQTMQARVNFITAVLRKESGASISPSEFATAEKMYFPAAGDDAKAVQQKQQARQTAIRGMKIQAGPGAAEIDKNLSLSSDLPPDIAALVAKHGGKK